MIRNDFIFLLTIGVKKFDYEDLSDIDASNLSLKGYSFVGCDLRGTSFKGSDLTGSDFENADFDERSSFEDAILTDCNDKYSSIGKANLHYAISGDEQFM
nr:pentapeptide repeat-containing protein [Moritella viscosa]SHO15537.1 Putative outer membrane adhesin like proteiin [Moritella viscosa]